MIEDADNLEEEVIEIVAVLLGYKKAEVSLDSRFVEDLGADSIDEVELVINLEVNFGIAITDENAEKIKTPRHLIKYLENLGE